MTIIVNPAAGNGKCGRTWLAVQDTFAGLSGSAALFTRAPGEATRLVREALLQGEEVILVVGGDGTLNEAINGFFLNQQAINPGARLAVLPAGTGSDFCRSLNGTVTPDILYRNIAQEKFHPCDVGLVTCVTLDNQPVARYFLNVSDAGLGAGVVSRRKTKPGWLGARMAYLLDVINTLLHHQAVAITMTIDKQKSETSRLLAAVVANGQYFGGGIRIAPCARLDDAQLRIVRIAELTVLDLLCNVRMLYNGRIAEHACVTMATGGCIAMTSATEALIETDGELIGKLPATFKIIPAALNLINSS
jgi:YegS/Rv2252/BmrU family lipid kinase